MFTDLIAYRISKEYQLYTTKYNSTAMTKFSSTIYSEGFDWKWSGVQGRTKL